MSAAAALRIVFAYAPTLYMNYHQVALIRALRRAATEWTMLDVSDVLRGARRPADLLAEARAADVLVLHSGVFAIRLPSVFADGAYYMDGPLPDAAYSDLVEALVGAPARRLLIGDNLDLHGRYETLGIRPEDFEGLAWFFHPRRFTSQAEPELAESWLPDPELLERNYQALSRVPTQIEMAFCLDSSEYDGAPRSRPWRVGVPGISYKRRGIARAAARAEGFRQPPFELARGTRLAARIAYRRLRWRAPTRWSIEANRRLHHAFIGRCELAYTDGSAYGYPVRKFVEIPAQRTLMLCTPHPGMADRGFRDGVTHVACEPDEVGRLARKLEPQSPAMRAVADAGFEVARRLHSAEARAAQFIEAVGRFARGALRSARFADGEYVYQP